MRILNLLPWRRRRLESDLDRELRDHVERCVADLTAAGMSESEARRRAVIELGGVAQTQEEVRDTWLWRWLDRLIADTRYSARVLRRTPGFTAAAMLSLALGIGANAAIFSLVDQVLLRQLAVPEPGRLVHVDWSGTSLSSEWGTGHLVSYPLCRDLETQDEVFDGVFCRHPSTVNFSTGDQHEPVRVELVSGSFFPVLGAHATLGRLISEPDDVEPGAHPIVVLSHPFWRNRFGAARDVVGRTVLVNNNPMIVIGVASQDFTGVDPVDVPALWIPAMMTAQVEPEIGPRLFDRRTTWMHAFGRLAPGLTVEQARTRLRPWFKSVLEGETRLEGFPAVSADVRTQFLASTIDLLPADRGWSAQRGALARPLWVLLAGTALLLLLACLNVAGLLLARGAARAHELSTRVALGASRSRITGQLLVESMLITLGGVLLGLLLAPAVSQSLLSFQARETDLGFRLDQRFFLFASLVALATAAVCGLVPALQAGRNSQASAIGDRSRIGASGSARLRRAIVVVQLAFTLILLIGAGLFVQTLAQLQTQDLGFSRGHLVMFRATPPAVGHSDSLSVRLMQALLRQLREAPGVERVAVANSSLLSGGSFSRSLTIDAGERVVTDRPVPGLRVSPGFFATMGTRIVAGREFGEQDVPRADDRSYRSIIVNESFARRYFGGQNPVGRRVGIGDRPETRTVIEIVGVIEDFNFLHMREESAEHFFLPFGHPSQLSADGTFYLRVRGDPRSAFGSIRLAVAAVDRALPVGSLTTLDEQIDRALVSERMLATLSSGFGTIALLLSMVGLYGIVSFLVVRRRQEIGVRLALGATRSAAVWLIAREAIVMIAAGTTIALPGVWALGRLVESQLFGVSAIDAPTVAAATLLLALVGLGAAMVPAWRAASVNPTESLRYE